MCLLLPGIVYREARILWSGPHSVFLSVAAAFIACRFTSIGRISTIENMIWEA